MQMQRSSAPPESSHDQRAVWLNAARSAGSRIVVLGISAVLGIVITRLVIQNFGEAAYAQYGLLIGLGALIPFADLGISGAVMNAIGESEDPRNDDRVRLILVSSIRIAVGSTVVVGLISLLLYLLGWWEAILGEGLNAATGPLAATLCLVLIGVAIPFGIGQRILSALSLNHLTIGLNGLQSPLVLSMLGLTVWLGWSGNLIAVFPYLASLTIAVIAAMIALRLVGPVARAAIRDAPRIRSVKGGRVVDMAWPLMIQMIALPLAMQTDRIVLSHVSDISDLAQYNMAAQIFTPVWALVTAAGFTLWPVFAKARAKSHDVSPVPMALVFGGIAGLLCAVLALFTPFLASIASDGEVTVSLLMIVSYSILMIFQGLKYPLGMYLTDPRGMRFQAFMVVAMVPVNLGLSIVLAERLGAAGPIIGSAVGVFLFQVVANYIYVQRERSRRRAEPVDADPLTDL